MVHGDLSPGSSGPRLTQLATSQLFGVRPTDSTTIASVVVLMTAVAAVAACLPARRAARIGPVPALRG